MSMFENSIPLPAPPVQVPAPVPAAPAPVPLLQRKNTAVILNECDHETDTSKFSNKLIPR